MKVGYRVIISTLSKNVQYVVFTQDTDSKNYAERLLYSKLSELNSTVKEPCYSGHIDVIAVI
mgnify:CR=1 FL=1